MDFGKKVLSQAKWLWLLRGFTQTISFIKLGVLARILSPQDFGFIALTTATINTIEVFSETGFNYALIHLQEEVHIYAKTVWIVTIVRGVLLSLLCILLAKTISIFFSSSLLYQYLLVAACIPLIKGFGNPLTVNFQKEIAFKKELIYRAIPIIGGSCITIFLVLLWHNAFGFLLGIVSEALLESLFSFIIAPIHMSSPFNLKYAKRLFAYGRWLTIGGLFDFISTQIDNVFVGKLMGPSVLGLYDISYKLSNVSYSYITDILSRVAFPLYAKKQKNKAYVRKSFLSHALLVAIPGILFFLLLNFFPSQILQVFFGEKWKAAHTILPILAWYGMFRALIGPTGPLFLALGKPNILTYFHVLNVVLLIMFLPLFSSQFGLQGVAWAVVLAYVISTLIPTLYVIKLFRT